MMAGVGVKRVGPWTVRVWLGTPTEPSRVLLAEGRVPTLTRATEYATSTDAATPVTPGEYVWAEAVSVDYRYVATFDTRGVASPWVPAER